MTVEDWWAEANIWTEADIWIKAHCPTETDSWKSNRHAEGRTEADSGNERPSTSSTEDWWNRYIGIEVDRTRETLLQATILTIAQKL